MLMPSIALESLKVSRGIFVQFALVRNATNQQHYATKLAHDALIQATLVGEVLFKALQVWVIMFNIHTSLLLQATPGFYCVLIGLSICIYEIILHNALYILTTLTAQAYNEGMNTLPHSKRCSVIRCLVDGCSIRATTRITGVAKNTIQKLTRDLGDAVLEYQNQVLRGIKAQRVQMDEIWCFCYAKDKNLPDEMRGMPGVGSIWTGTAMDADTKRMISWKLGARDAATAHAFMSDVAERLANRVQLTTDGNRTYLDAVETCFGCAIDYATLIKVYGNEPEGESRYSPAKCLSTKKQVIMGDPDPADISTGYAERQNLNIRMQNRRYTRLTNAFSKKAEMLAYAVAITFFYHNFVRIHQTAPHDTGPQGRDR
jgi:IS1 family transposase